MVLPYRWRRSPVTLVVSCPTFACTVKMKSLCNLEMVDVESSAPGLFSMSASPSKKKSRPVGTGKVKIQLMHTDTSDFPSTFSVRNLSFTTICYSSYLWRMHKSKLNWTNHYNTLNNYFHHSSKKFLQFTCSRSVYCECISSYSEDRVVWLENIAVY